MPVAVRKAGCTQCTGLDSTASSAGERRRRITPRSIRCSTSRIAISDVLGDADLGSAAPAGARVPGEQLPIERLFDTVGGVGEYAELHCHTNFSFLDGASHPEELVAEAARLGLAALAVTDHDGFYGIVRFALAARGYGLPTVFGAELTLHAGRARGEPGHPARGRSPLLRPSSHRSDAAPDPPGEHLVVLAEGPVGHARLSRAISEAQMAGEKGAPR